MLEHTTHVRCATMYARRDRRASGDRTRDERNILNVHNIQNNILCRILHGTRFRSVSAAFV